MASPVTGKAWSLSSTSYIPFVLWDHSKMTWEHLSPILSSAEQWDCLQLPFYLSLPSTTCLVTLVFEKETGNKFSKVFRETGFSSTCHFLTRQLVTCHSCRFVKQALDSPAVKYKLCDKCVLISTVHCSVLVTGNINFNCMETHICVCACRVGWGVRLVRIIKWRTECCFFLGRGGSALCSG